MKIFDKETLSMVEAVKAVLENTSVEEAKKWKLTSMSKDEAVESVDEALKTTHVVIDTADGNKIVSSASNEKLAKSSIVSAERPPMSIKDKKTLKVVQLKKPVSLNKDIIGTTLKEEAFESVDEATKLSSKEEAVVLKLMSSTKTAQEAAKKVEKQMKIPYKEALEIVRNVMKQYESVEESTDLDEAFKRIPGNMINNELPRAAKDLESVIRGLKSGNDFNEKAFNKVLADLNSIKKSAKSFKSEDDVTKPYQYRADPRYKSEQYESVEEATDLEEAFKRLPGDAINDALPRVIKDLEGMLGSLKVGNDFDEKRFNKNIAALNTIKKEAKKFNSKEEVPTRYRYTKESVESVEETTDLDESFIVYIPKQKINGKLIPKSEIKIDAKAKDKAIKMAAKKLGTDFLALKVDKVVKESTDLEEASKEGDKAAYRAFFNKAMKKFGINDITDLKGDKKKEFFDYVDANWKADNEVEESTQIDEAKLKAGKGKVTIDIDYAGDNPKQVEQSFKVKLKKTGKDGYDLSGEKKNVLAYLQSKDYDMDPEDIKDLFPELLESTQIDETKRMKYDKVIKKLKDGDWESSYDVVPRKHLIYIDTKTGKQHSIFVESTLHEGLDREKKASIDKLARKLSQQIRKLVRAKLKKTRVEK